MPRQGPHPPGNGANARVDQVSRLPLPPFDKAAMDGYAILAGDVCDRYQVLETVLAGSTPTAPLRPGTAVKVMTGARSRRAPAK